MAIIRNITDGSTPWYEKPMMQRLMQKDRERAVKKHSQYVRKQNERKHKGK